MYGEPEHTEGHDPLPSTSFGNEEEAGWEDPSGKRKHRKSKSYANMTDYERGRRLVVGGELRQG